MRHAVAALMLSTVATWAAPAAAQSSEEPPLISKTYIVDVAPAETVAFEQALREHFASPAAHDPWAWYTWQVVNGSHQGRYVIRSHGHRWQDFDDRADLERLDRADFSATVAPHVRAISSRLERLEPRLSSWSMGAKRPALVEVFVYDLEPGGLGDFTFALGKIHRAMAQKNPDMEYAWSVVVNGGDGPAMILAVPHSSWAEIGSRPSSPARAMIDEYGAHEAQLLRGLLDHATRRRISSILVLREDLSYEPK